MFYKGRQNTSHKLNHFAQSTWRKIFLIRENELHKTKEKVIFDRSSTVPQLFVGDLVKIYNGKTFKTRQVNRWMVGFKFGEFTWNRKIALYKAKQLKKKKKK